MYENLAILAAFVFLYSLVSGGLEKTPLNGAVIVGQSIGPFSWQVVIYSLLSLTIVRMLPVFLVLAGMNLRTDEKLFMGWFGPRGLASIVFAVIVLNEHLPGGGTISMTVVCTILLSIIAHVVSANPLIAVLRARLKHSAKLTDC